MSEGYPIIDIEPLSNSSNTSLEQKLVGYHGTSSSNANSIIEGGFTKQAFAGQGENGLRPHERGLYTSPDWEVAAGYAYNNDGRPGEILGVWVPGEAPHIVTGTYMDKRGIIKEQMDKANEKFGRGNYSFTGPQDPKNEEPETITQFPTAGIAEAFPLSEKHYFEVEPTHEVTSVDKFYCISAADLPNIHTLERFGSEKPEEFYVKKK